MLLWLLACTPTPSTAPDAVGTCVSDDGERREARPAHLAGDWSIGAEQALPADDPVAGLARKPQVAADGQRVLVVWSTGDPRSSSVVLAEANAPEGPYTTRILATGSGESAITLVDQPDVSIAPDGEAWVGFKAEVDHPVVELRIARERASWVPTPITPSGGTPCECCPHLLDWLPDGDAWLVLRGNDRNIREIHEARLAVAEPPSPGADLTLVRTTQVSHTNWFVQGCPFDGPGAVAIDEDRRLVAWVDPTAGPARAWVAATSDGGLTWSDARPVLADDDRIDQEPTFALLDDGTVVLAVDDYWTGTALLAAPARAWLAATDTPVVDHADARRIPLSRPLWDVVLAPFADTVLAVGVDAEGAVWAEPLVLSD